MAKKPRTFQLKQPPMRGDDVKGWQLDIRRAFAKMSIDCPIKIDGIYGHSTRSYGAALVRASGLSVKTQMEHGVKPELRVKLRNDDLTPAQRKVKNSPARKDYRRKLREQWAPAKKVHAPVDVIINDSWGYHPGLHDGVDVMTKENAILYAMTKVKIIDVRKDGWWGKGAPSDPTIKAKGDGIIQMEVLETVGPFKKGMHIGYGHAEKAMVKVGDIVDAGHPVGRAGYANGWHTHLMANSGNTTSGIGTQDPLPLINYAVKHG